MEIGTISYGLAAIAFSILTILLLVSWRGRIQGAILTGATATSAIWAGITAYQIAAERRPLVIADLFELLRDGLWLAFLMTLLAGAAAGHRPFRQELRTAAVGITTFLLLLVALTLFRTPDVFQSFAIPDYFTGILGRLILSLVGVVVIHQLYLNVLPAQRWGIKFLCLGAGGMFVYDFYLYSDAMLFKRLDLVIWDARGIVNTFIVPLIAISAARNAEWSLEIAVSRRMVFQSTALVGAGIYLLGMAGAGYYIRFFGGQWGTVFQVTFLFAALILLLIILFSGAVRARLKVFVSKHFFSYRYDYREEWLRFTRTLSEGEPGVQLRERSIQAIAELVESPGGALWLRRDTGNFERVAHWNLPGVAGTLEVENVFAVFLGQRQWVINVDECDAHPERYDDLALPTFLRAIPRAWLIVPLILHEQLVGFIVLARSQGQVTLNWEVSDLLKTAGRQAASYLAQLEAASALLVARQFDSFNRMSAFVVHDLKNLVSQLSLLLSNAERHKDNPEFQQDMLETVDNSVEKMKRLLTQLKTGNPAPEASITLSLDAIIKAAIAAQAGSHITPEFEMNGQTPQIVAGAERLTRILGHLIRNAIEATPVNGKVTVHLATEEKFAIMEVTDTGRGMSEQFIRDKLFRPFESTKQTGMGVGAYECQQYVAELGGRIQVESKESMGTTFRVWLPRADRADNKELVLETKGTA
ncbi:MAG: XrtA/PEP-CTERM system histidine kinase PrsK [Pseudomonadota bacterium]